jgi:predicted nicotinamide N-methyase
MESITNTNSTEKSKKHQWNKLKQIILSKEKLHFLDKISSIELKLFDKEIIDNEDGLTINYRTINETILKLIIDKYEDEFNFKGVQIIKHKVNSHSDELLSEKVDNTGNVQLWPSEEILAIYCLMNRNKFDNKKIIELGAGFCGFSSLLIAQNIPTIKEVVITDGNTKCVEAIKENIKLNNLEKDKVKERVLLWDRTTSFEEKELNSYDYILISDCIFFKNYHIDLIYTIKSLLSSEGVCIIVSPPRGDSLELFLNLAEEKFSVYKSQEEISFHKIIIKSEEDNKFNPYFIELRKK